jgi:hypothetical protein
MHKLIIALICILSLSVSVSQSWSRSRSCWVGLVVIQLQYWQLLSDLSSWWDADSGSTKIEIYWVSSIDTRRHSGKQQHNMSCSRISTLLHACCRYLTESDFCRRHWNNMITKFKSSWSPCAYTRVKQIAIAADKYSFQSSHTRSHCLKEAIITQAFLHSPTHTYINLLVSAHACTFLHACMHAYIHPLACWYQWAHVWSRAHQKLTFSRLQNYWRPVCSFQRFSSSIAGTKSSWKPFFFGPQWFCKWQYIYIYMYIKYISTATPYHERQLHLSWTASIMNGIYHERRLAATALIFTIFWHSN